MYSSSRDGYGRQQQPYSSQSTYASQTLGGGGSLLGSFPQEPELGGYRGHGHPSAPTGVAASASQPSHYGGQYNSSVYASSAQQSKMYDRLDQAALLRQEQLLKAHALQSGSAEAGARSSQQQQQETTRNDFDAAYFHSYAHLGIHEEMIKDRVRTETYRNAIFAHKDRIAGKVVVDVGCGTGILSIFCAQAGAKRVYAVDASDIAVQANEVVKTNNLSDKIIVLHGRVEDVEIDDKVDVIVSEWMGYMLLYESMLGSVIAARDRWLKPGGLILPSYATLYMAPISHPDRYSESIDFWRNVYGIDMSAMMPLAKQCSFEEPSVETISGENVLTWPHVVKHLDCCTITIQELESVSTKFKFKSMMRAPLNGFAFWFDVEFGAPAICSSNIDAPPAINEAPDNHAVDISQRKKRANPSDTLVLSTAPEDPSTHWQQTVIYLYDPLDLEQDQLIEGSLLLSQSKENPRFMNIRIEYESGGRSFVKESVMR